MTTGRINQVTILQAGPGRRPKPDHTADRDTTLPKEGRNLVVNQAGAAFTR
jgi:hypothetical protein